MYSYRYNGFEGLFTDKIKLRSTLIELGNSSKPLSPRTEYLKRTEEEQCPEHKMRILESKVNDLQKEIRTKNNDIKELMAENKINLERLKKVSNELREYIENDLSTGKRKKRKGCFVVNHDMIHDMIEYHFFPVFKIDCKDKKKQDNWKKIEDEHHGGFIVIPLNFYEHMKLCTKIANDINKVVRVECSCYEGGDINKLKYSMIADSVDIMNELRKKDIKIKERKDELENLYKKTINENKEQKKLIKEIKRERDDLKQVLRKKTERENWTYSVIKKYSVFDDFIKNELEKITGLKRDYRDDIKHSIYDFVYKHAEHTKQIIHNEFNTTPDIFLKAYLLTRAERVDIAHPSFEMSRHKQIKFITNILSQS